MDELRQGRLLRDKLQRAAEGGEAGADRMDEQLGICGQIANVSMAWADERATPAVAAEGPSRAGVGTGPGDCAVARTGQADIGDGWR